MTLSTRGIPMSREQLTEHLTTEIVAGTIAVNTVLPSERALAEQYGLSRPIVREALRSLQERGLITIAPGRGAFVRRASALDWARPLDAAAMHRGATARELVEARVMLEERAAALAAARATAQDVEDLRSALAAFDAATGVLERARRDIAFHALIARSAHNPVIEMMFGAIAPLIFELMLRSLDDADVVERGVPYHGQILRAIEKGDARTAARAMDEHVSLACTMFGHDIDASLQVLAERKVASLLGPGAELEDVIAEALAVPSQGPSR